MAALSGSACLITGGGSGLGRGLVKRFVREGAKVVVLELAAPKIASLEEEYKRSDVVVVPGDVGRLEDHERAVSVAVEEFGSLDTLVGCAAITDYAPAVALIPSEKISEAFDEVMRVNVKGYLFAAEAAMSELAKTNGSMIFTLSTSAFFPGGQGALYSMSKAACTMLVRQLAYELAPRVRVNAVVPGAIRTSEIHGPAVLEQTELTPEIVVPEMETVVKEATPLGIYAEPEDYGDIYVLLANKSASRMATGSIVSWDGGIGLIGHGSDVMKFVQSQPI